MLGREVSAACHARGDEVVAMGRAALDITNPVAVDRAMARYEPDVVVNCAGFTDLEAAEGDERAAMRVNDEGAALLAAAAATIGAKYVYPSANDVFDGSRRRGYVESDIPAPLSAYGRSKQAGETSVAVANPRHFVVRSAWLFGFGGDHFVETMLRLADEQPEVLAVSDQVGSPTFTRHLGEAIAMLIEGGDFGIHHLAGGGQCSWYEFAQEIYDQAGLECRVMGATSEMLAQRASRPQFAPLRTERPDAITRPDWRRGLADYLAERRLAGAPA